MTSYAEEFLKSATSAASSEDTYFIQLSNALTSCAEAGTRYFTGMMSPSQQHDENKMKEVLCVSFNQDSSCLAVGHEDGYVFYTPKAIDNLEKLQEGKMPKRVYIVERLYNSSLITMVSKNSTRKLQVYHSIKDNEIVSSTYTGAILSVRLNRKRVVVCLEDAIHIHNVRDMKLLHIIKDTPLNPLGIIDLSADDSASYLAFPGSSSTGHVMVFDTEALAATCSFSAHAGPLVALRFSPDGTKLATASDKGTVIRVFGIPNGDRLFEFTRGVKRCVTISSLSFSIDSKYLCLSSNTETVHVFSLVRQEGSPEQARQDDLSAQEGIGAWVNYFSQQATAYLPTHMNELMLREKSVAIARLPISDTKTAVAMPRIAGKDYLMVASTEGYLFLYMLDTESGECPLIRQYRIGPNADDMDNSGTPIPLNTNSPNNRPISSDFDTLPSSGGGVLQTGKTTSGGSIGSGDANVVGGGGSADAGWSSVKPPPPPIPPAPKKRGGLNEEVVGGNISQKNGKGGGNNNPFDGKAMSGGKQLAGGGGGGLISTNPFDVDDTYLYEDDELDKGSGAKRRSGGGGETDSSLEAPADLNDMDEFPPLSHVTL